MHTGTGLADCLLDQDQLGAFACQTVVLPHRDVGGLDLWELAQHELVAGPVGVGAGLSCVFVLVHDDETL
nr:hypothetical protein [uncultured Actinomyces sp.]